MCKLYICIDDQYVKFMYNSDVTLNIFLLKYYNVYLIKIFKYYVLPYFIKETEMCVFQLVRS